MSEHLIELRRIVKRYGTGEAAFNALGGIDLTIDQGEFVAIIGQVNDHEHHRCAR